MRANPRQNGAAVLHYLCNAKITQQQQQQQQVFHATTHHVQS